MDESNNRDSNIETSAIKFEQVLIYGTALYSAPRPPA
jgi:hypothetical protein